MNNNTFSSSDKKSNLQIPEIPLNSRTGSGILSSNSRRTLLSSLLTLDDEFDMQSTPDNRLSQKSIKGLASLKTMQVKENLLPRNAEDSRPQTAPSELENCFDCLVKKPSFRYDGTNKGDTFELNETNAENIFISQPKTISNEKCKNRSSLILRDLKRRSPSWEPQKSSCLTSNLTFVGDGSTAKVRQMQNELDSMRNLLKMVKDYHKEEIELLKQSYASRIEMLEENSKRREKHLKKELEFSSTHYNTRINQLEELLEANRTEFTSTVGTVKDDTFKIVANLQKEHNIELETLVEQHAKTIENLRRAESIEAEALNEMQPTAEAIKSLFAELVSAVKELNHTEAENTAAFSQRFTKLDGREEVLRMAEERLLDREKEIDKMHIMLTGAIGKLEVQLKEQNKSLEEDRWALKQEQVRLSKLQIDMEEDRRALIEHAGKERTEFQKLITNFLEEHREMQSRLALEHKAALEERQELKSDKDKWESKKKEERNKLNRLKEELERAKEAFLIERHALDERTDLMVL
nr:fas binding factor 1 [Hymenolepis microstoma]